ncbi:MAG: DEAD/DEAH box helicase [Verrucomicrobiota bacterium]
MASALDSSHTDEKSFLQTVDSLFDPEVHLQGRQIAAHADVRILTQEISPSYAAVYGVVKDQGQRFDVSLLVQSSGDSDSHLDGRCSCDLGHNCEHVAAVLFRVRGDRLDLERELQTFPLADLKPVLQWSRADARSGIPGASESENQRLKDICIGRLVFKYGEYVVDPEDDNPLVFKNGSGSPAVGRRLLDFETEFLADLKEEGLLRLDALFPPKTINPALHGHVYADTDLLKHPWEIWWNHFTANKRVNLELAGWGMESTAELRLDLTQPDDYYARFSETENLDWLEFEYGIVVDGKQINLLPVLVTYLEQERKGGQPCDLTQLGQGAHVPIPLGDGRRLLAFPADRLKGILEVITELADPDNLDENARFSLPPIRAAEISGQLGKQKHLRVGSPDIHRTLARIEETFAGETICEPAEKPQGFNGDLRSYQKEGVAWMQLLRDRDLGGVLADDMGLGKTVQTLCHLQCEKSAGRADLPSIIVAPTSVVGNWQAEAAKFAPDLRVLAWQGSRRLQYVDCIPSCDILLTSFPLLSRDIATLKKVHFHLAILDEAQTIKNARSKTSEAACSLKARHRLCLSGTPMENNLGELWSLFHFLMPGFLGSSENFQQVYRQPIEKNHDEARLQHLQKRLLPFMLRRTKDRVAHELPPKTEIVRKVALGPKQAELYESVRAWADKRIHEEMEKRGFDGSRFFVLNAILKLRQLCCDPRLLNLSETHTQGPSAKLEALMDMLTQMKKEGRRVLIFSQFTSMLGIIAERLNDTGCPFLMLTGSTRDRSGMVKKFQEGQTPVFLISLKAGATGLNLTKADTVIHYDPWWNPAVENQATDRAYRIGQTQPVFVYKMVAEGTLEEKILQLQERKTLLVKTLLGQDVSKINLSQTEIERLLAPIKKG